MGRMFTAAGALLLVCSVLLNWSLATVLLWILGLGSVARLWEFIPPARWFRLLLNSRVLHWLGTISYPLYLLHWPLLVCCISTLLYLRKTWTPGEMLTILAFTYLPITLLSAWLVHIWIERPGMRWGRKLCCSAHVSPR